jgi:hypothetical protein
MIVDPNVEQVRKVREALVKRHGGLQGWIRQLQKEESASRTGRVRKKLGRVSKATKSKPASNSKSVRQTQTSKKRV